MDEAQRHQRQYNYIVLQSIVGAFFFAIILAAFAFVYTFSKEDTSIKAGSDVAKVVQQPVTSTDTDSIPTLSSSK